MVDGRYENLNGWKYLSTNLEAQLEHDRVITPHKRRGLMCEGVYIGQTKKYE